MALIPVPSAHAMQWHRLNRHDRHTETHRRNFPPRDYSLLPLGGRCCCWGGEGGGCASNCVWWGDQGDPGLSCTNCQTNRLHISSSMRAVFGCLSLVEFCVPVPLDDWTERSGGERKRWWRTADQDIVVIPLCCMDRCPVESSQQDFSQIYIVCHYKREEEEVVKCNHFDDDIIKSRGKRVQLNSVLVPGLSDERRSE